MYIGSKASKVITNGNGPDVVTGTVIEVGASVLDTKLSSYTDQNLIVIGGPAINRAAASLLGLKYPAYGTSSGIQENTGMLKLVEQANGNVAIIVAGWEAIDTQRACRVVAEIDNYDLTGNEMVVTGTSLTNLDINEPNVSEQEINSTD